MGMNAMSQSKNLGAASRQLVLHTSLAEAWRMNFQPKTTGARRSVGGVQRCLLLFVALGLLSAACCDDPYSRRRIQRRWDKFNVTANQIGQREVDGTERVDEDMRKLRTWWKSDCERFNRKVPTVGDYVW
jgi:hypothetical protein